jgi:hypothetical protein
LIYFPLFYISKEAIYSGLNADQRALSQVTQDALVKYKTNLVEDTISCCKVWFPLNVINFTFLPLHWRQPFLSGAGLIWVFILSLSRGNENKGKALREESSSPMVLCEEPSSSALVPSAPAM